MEEQFLLLLSRLRRRLQGVVAFQTALRWGWWGCAVSILAAALLKLIDSPGEDLWNCPWIAVVFALCGFCWSWSRPPSLRRVAALTDASQNLQERLVSVLDEQQSARPKTSVAQFLLQDALRALRGVDPLSTFPNHWKRPLLKILPPLLVVAAINLSPSWGNLFHRVSASDRQAMQRSGQRIEDLARRLRDQNPHSPRAHHLASRLDQLAHKLRKANRDADRSSASADLDETLRQLRREQASLQGGMQRLAQQTRSQTPAQARAAVEKARAQAVPGSQQEKQLADAEAKLAKGQAAQAAQQIEALAREEQLADEAQEGLLAENEALEPGAPHPDRKSRAGNQPGSKTEGEVAVNPGGSQEPEKAEKTDKADFGTGTTNLEEKSQGPLPKGPRLERQAATHSSKQEAYERLYQSQRDHFQTADTKIKGQRGQGRVMAILGSGLGKPKAGGASALTPGDTFLESKADAEQAIAQGSIPGPYQDVVRSYFQQIDPR